MVDRNRSKRLIADKTTNIIRSLRAISFVKVSMPVYTIVINTGAYTIVNAQLWEKFTVVIRTIFDEYFGN